MRVLVTTTGSAGHFGPVVPFVDAVLAAGDEVLVATRESTAAQVRAAGDEVWPFADGPTEQRDAIFAEARDLQPLFADQPYNARRVAELGAGVALEQGPHGIAGAAAAVRAVLADPCYADRAAAFAADVRSLPTVDTAVDILRDLVALQRA
jgi:UDP:flavonoid glycosyltransferase YjiC (YdhE family)